MHLFKVNFVVIPFCFFFVGKSNHLECNWKPEQQQTCWQCCQNKSTDDIVICCALHFVCTIVVDFGRAIQSEKKNDDAMNDDDEIDADGWLLTFLLLFIFSVGWLNLKRVTLSNGNFYSVVYAKYIRIWC